MQRIFRRRAGGPPPVGGRRRIPSLPRPRLGGARPPGAGRPPGLAGRLPLGDLAQRVFRRRSGPPLAPPPSGAPLEGQPGAGPGLPPQVVLAPGGQSFRDRGHLRRRLRHLRRARELGYRDLGGLLFDLRRFGRTRPDLVEAKLDALTTVDRELRTLEVVLDDRRAIHELREPGIASCPRCGALHSSESHFCPNCGLPLDGPRAMGELGGAIAGPPGARAPYQAPPQPPPAQPAPYQAPPAQPAPYQAPPEPPAAQPAPHQAPPAQPAPYQAPPQPPAAQPAPHQAPPDAPTPPAQPGAEPPAGDAPPPPHTPTDEPPTTPLERQQASDRGS